MTRKLLDRRPLPSELGRNDASNFRSWAWVQYRIMGAVDGMNLDPACNIGIPRIDRGFAFYPA